MRSFPDPELGGPDYRSPGRYLRWLAGLHRATIVLGVVYGSAFTVAQALMPAAVGRAIDDGLTARNEQALVLWGAALLGLGMLQAVTSILQDRCALTNSLGASYRTLQLITEQASRLGATLPKRVSAGEVMSVGITDVIQIGRALQIVSRGVGAAVAIVVIAVIMLTASWELGLVVLIGVPLMVWVMATMLRPLHERQYRLREQQGELTSQAVDIVSGLRVLRGIGGEGVFAGRYREESQRVREAAVQVARVEALLGAAKVLLPGLLVALVVWLGARWVLDGRITAGQLVAFYGYAVFLALPLRRLTGAAGTIMKGHVAARRVTRLLALEPEISSGRRKPVTSLDAAALTDPASGLVVRPATFTAVACALPADAAVLADRLGRYTDSDVAYGGVALRELSLDEVRRRIVVAGDDRLFSGPMRTELDPADRAVTSPRLLEDAIDTAGARDVVDALPDGLDTVIAESGREFSGGQQQRLRLARAVMSARDVLVLVEPTSAVDAHTEALIAARLAAKRAGRKTVVFTTSPVVLNQADHVVYVEAEQAVAEGTHAELLTDARYRAVVAREEEDPP